MISVNTPLLDGNEKKYLIKCIDSGWISSDGPFVNKFEKKFSKYIGKKFSSSVSSGTAALEIAFRSINLKKNDEVILPTFSIISCLLPILRNGAKPIFVDCDENTWNMNVESIEKKITKKTKAVLAVHIYGLPANILEIKKITNKNKIFLIEDAAEAHGIEINGKKCGSFGDIGIFSFYANKHITSGEGGMVVTDNLKLFKKINYFKNLCFGKNEQRFVHREEGWNFRMSNLQAAVGLAQLEKINKTIKIKKKIGEIYNKYLSKFNNKIIKLPEKFFLKSNNHYWVYGIVLNPKYKITAAKIIKKLKLRGIATRPFFFPLHKQPLLKKYKFKIKDTFPNAEKISKYGFYLPSGVGLTIKELRKVIKIFKEIINDYI